VKAGGVSVTMLIQKPLLGVREYLFPGFSFTLDSFLCMTSKKLPETPIFLWIEIVSGDK
jgi:hypothetical protein